mmetsp:Transcript_8749/g.16933  ORF Transcript_8749/g.16933 Transcript_8749/m.16933 type:complete len:205 (+) Transcript_8749:82-696(+)
MCASTFLTFLLLLQPPMEFDRCRTTFLGRDVDKNGNSLGSEGGLSAMDQKCQREFVGMLLMISVVVLVVVVGCWKTTAACSPPKPPRPSTRMTKTETHGGSTKTPHWKHAGSGGGDGSRGQRRTAPRGGKDEGDADDDRGWGEEEEEEERGRTSSDRGSERGRAGDGASSTPFDSGFDHRPFIEKMYRDGYRVVDGEDRDDDRR